MRGKTTNSVVSFILNLAYPAECPVCRDRSDNHATSPFCSGCWSGMLPYVGPSCGFCARPLPSGHAPVCGECLKKRPPFKRAFSFGRYEGTLRDAIHSLKFQPVKRLAKPLGMLMSGFDYPPFDGVVPVPLSPGGLRERGFNQSLLIARVLASLRGAPLMAGLLYKKKETPPQVSLSRSARLENLKGAFGVRGKLRGERLLLVDDVITTGATASECSRILLRAGAGEVYVASLARA